MLGSCFGLGYLPASGTLTVAVVGVPLFYLLEPLPWWGQLVVLLPLLFVAVWLSGAGDRILGEKDSRKMVADEIVGYLVAVLGLPFTWPVVITSFVLERAIDIAKIPPAPWIERRVPGGWGVVLDDAVAGIYTALILQVLLRLRPDWLGC